jgi:signal transduction histidine kinase
MFTHFARRLTSWYVAAAVVLVVAVLGAFAVVALVLYVKVVNDGIDNGAHAATGFAARAVSRHETFKDAAIEFQQRERHTGVRVIASRAPRPPLVYVRKDTPPSQFPLTLRPPVESPQRRADELKRSGPGTRLDGPPPAALTIYNGSVTQREPRSLRFQGSRIGFALATLFGAHVQRVSFVDGDMSFSPDPDAVQALAAWLLLGILVVGALAGVLAWFLGRYITWQVLRPLIEVTHALQRFAARDFSAQPIAVAGKSEFDAIALAYNAAAAQVESAFAERAQAETQMRQFVADAGHELRTPLTIVLGYIELLRRKADAGDERSIRIFRSISAEGARMRTLIDNLVLLARMEGEDLRPAEPFDLAPLLDEIADSRRVITPGLRIELDVGVDAMVIGNRDEIHEAISNVVDNAIKYAPRSPIRIGARQYDGGIEVTIADEGPGIREEDRAGIFDRFYRGSTRGDVEGSGLGLAIAKRAVDRAGGTLLLAQTSPSGTTFALRLRADRVQRRETARATRA